MFDLCGDHMATIVLERLVYWWPRGTRRQLSEAEWLCKPRQQLEIECRMTAKQCRMALEILKAKHLVETTAAKWAGSVGPLMHFRLLPRALVLVPKPVRDEFSTASGGKNTTSKTGSVMAPKGQVLDHMVGIDTKPSYGFSYEKPTECLDAKIFSSGEISGKDEGVTEGMSLPKKSKKISSAECGKSTPKQSSPKTPSPAKVAMQAKLGMSAPAILGAKKVAGALPVPKAAKGSGKPWLGLVWREAYAEAFPNAFQAPLTKQQLGQLKMIAAKLQPLDAKSVIRKILNNWVSFSYAVMNEAGALKIPQKPEVGVVLKFVNVAANFKTPVVKAAPVAETGYAPAPAQLIAQTSEGAEPMPSKAEVMAMLLGTDAKG